MQRALIQYRRPENYDLVKEALLKEGRQDLIGFGEHCLIPPRKLARDKKNGAEKKPTHSVSKAEKGKGKKHSGERSRNGRRKQGR
jgi:hypothetical protein